MDLQKALADRARELGVRIRFDAKVANADFSLPLLELDTGETVEGDLVVAADGLWSKLRSQFLGTPTPPTPTGRLAYRILISKDQVNEPDLVKWIAKPRVSIFVGPDVHAVAYSIRRGSLLNMVLDVPDDLPPHVARASGNLGEMKRLFHGWNPM